MRIQHNIMAMNAYRNYNNNTKALSGNLEKLSSGYKINRAGDDAAGLAISEKMRAQITGLDAAQKNVKDGVSLVKTAEGAMQEIQDMLNRMDYLATQSANGTYDNEVDRLNLQKEVNQLRSEINRIADSANFNGIKLLDGSLADGQSTGGQPQEVELSNVVIHKTGNKGVTASFEINLNGIAGTQGKNTSTGMVEVKVGDVTLTIDFDSVGSTGAAITAGNLNNANTIKIGGTAATTANLNGTVFDISLSNGVISFTQNKKTEADAVDFVSDLSVTATVKGTDITQDASSKVNIATQNVIHGVKKTSDMLASASMTLTADMVAEGASLKVGGEIFTFDYTTDTVGGTNRSNGNTIYVKDLLDSSGKIDSTKLEKVADRITEAYKGTTKASSFSLGSDGTKLTLQELTANATGSTPPFTEDVTTEEKLKALFSFTGASGTGKALMLQIGDTSDSYNQLNVSVGDMHTYAMGSGSGSQIKDIDISTQSGAASAIGVIRDAINYVSSVRGDLGATQNRLEHTQNNLSVMAENIQDAESTIRDTDVADEMMKYVKNNILVQSAQAMLAQANQVPQGVLQLLG